MANIINAFLRAFPQRAIASELFLLLFLPAITGCASTRLPPAPPGGDGKGYLLHLPGVGGDLVFDHLWLSALHDGGVEADMELYDWTGGNGWIGALQAYQHNKDEAQKVADRIAARLRADPGRPVLLTAESGGTGVALWALERLPEGVQVDSVLLVAPALSPDYDLTPALRHVRGHLYAVSSPLDIFILGLCTSVLGTTDGVRSPAAGETNFHRPPAADPLQYQKVVTMPWRPRWAVHGNFGNHSGAISPLFSRYVLAPMLCREIKWK